MGRRRKARESALQILFQLEFNSSDADRLARQYWDIQKAAGDVKEYGSWIVQGIRANSREIDDVIQRASENWRIARMAAVDRNILRIAVFELLKEKTLAPAIVINEAIEIAKKYSGDEAAVFINGVLDAVHKKLKIEQGQQKEGNHAQKRRIPRKSSGSPKRRTQEK
ncbi:MAG: transcription antitermination factor NusB [Acidobacteriota bacterium]|nr:transcription antitermination factor NusB [Acidobacteriota bacterium]